MNRGIDSILFDTRYWSLVTCYWLLLTQKRYRVYGGRYKVEGVGFRAGV